MVFCRAFFCCAAVVKRCEFLKKRLTFSVKPLRMFYSELFDVKQSSMEQFLMKQSRVEQFDNEQTGTTANGKGGIQQRVLQKEKNRS